MVSVDIITFKFNTPKKVTVHKIGVANLQYVNNGFVCEFSHIYFFLLQIQYKRLV